MITFMMFYISMNLGNFACIVSFGLRTGTNNIRDYVGLYAKYPFFGSFLALSLILRRSSSTSRFFFEKLHLFWCGWQVGLYFLVSIGLLMSVVSVIHNDTMSALGRPHHMFSDIAIQLQHVFAQWIQNTYPCPSTWCNAS